MTTLSAAFLCAIAYFICFGGNWLIGQNMADQPIVVGPFVGLLLGDLQTGLILGASLQALFIGAINVGGAVSLNPSFGTTLAVAFSILSGGGEQFALALAVPLGLLGGLLEIGVNILCAAFGPLWDKAAAEGNDKKIVGLHFGVWLLKYLLFSAVIFIAIFAGATPVTNFVNNLPDFITEGLGVVAGLLPAVGFAMLLKMVWSGKLALFYLLGFLAVAYLELPLIAVATLGLIVAFAQAMIDKDMLDIKNQANNSSIGDNDQTDEEEDFLS
ncbi:PTS sugar transporter subunit IIC [Tetragenococcus koreensis]|nr:PTS sugar transporter subunit IIC [Tetragenococcus koreensis]MCF1615199.1 PTS sugar transporter subunit IIC [Tetragenococcus koreensis]MCF1624979.1 PTS sugar transporter subunit IIC [Tetragenococcus koreensis]MCF1642807.1 PTS sugar transporter subunit IIC [Tetragenococcus koreensis]MDN6731183.1 PTS sugar transporter subunit IIC [Atopostipes suicloacalis]